MEEELPDLVLGPPFSEALAFAFHRHWDQARKGSGIPYVAHLLQACGIVFEAGGDEEQAIAALLHDAIEDAPKGQADWVRQQIRGRFGERVLRIVEACTDSDEQPKPDWRPRKERFLKEVPHKPSDALLVSSADKLHNARAILRDLREVGDRLWERFTGGKDGTLWYYRELVRVFEEAGGTPLLAELGRTVSMIESEAA